MTTIADLSPALVSRILNGSCNGVPFLDARYRFAAAAVCHPWNKFISDPLAHEHDAIDASRPKTIHHRYCRAWLSGRVVCASVISDCIEGNQAGQRTEFVAWLLQSAVGGGRCATTVADALVTRSVRANDLERAALFWDGATPGCLFECALEAVDGDRAHAVVALAKHAIQRLDKEPPPWGANLPARTPYATIDRMTSVMWRRVIERGAVWTAATLVGLVQGLDHGGSPPHDHIVAMIESIKQHWDSGAWLRHVARSNEIKVFDACQHLRPYTRDLSMAARYGNVTLMHRLLERIRAASHDRRPNAVKYAIVCALHRVPTREDAVAFLDYMVQESPLPLERSDLFPHNVPLWLSVVLERWPQLLDTEWAARYGAGAVWRALAFVGVEEAQRLVDALGHRVAHIDVGIWSSMLWYTGFRAETIARYISAACVLADLCDSVPRWRVWAGPTKVISAADLVRLWRRGSWNGANDAAIDAAIAHLGAHHLLAE